MPESKKVAGIFYEAIVQSYLQDGRILKLILMVTLEKKKRKRPEDKSQHQWYSSHIIIDNPALEAHCLKVSNTFDVNIHPNQILEYSDNGLQSIKLNIFYIPEMTNQKAFDCSFCSMASTTSSRSLLGCIMTLIMDSLMLPTSIGFHQGTNGISCLSYCLTWLWLFLDCGGWLFKTFSLTQQWSMLIQLRFNNVYIYVDDSYTSLA